MIKNSNTNTSNLPILADDVKIMSIEGAEILKNNLQNKFISKDYSVAFNKSMLLNKLVDLGLDVSKGKTKDIINLSFSHGFNTDPEKMKQLKAQKKELTALIKDSNAADSNYSTKIKKMRVAERKVWRETRSQITKEINKLKMSHQKVREKLYEEGFFLDFYKVARDESRRIIKDENGKKKYVLDKRIHYKYWMRTSSKALEGKVFFINQELLDPINIWQNMGMEFSDGEEMKLVELEAYKGLIASNIESFLHIDAEREILVLDDLDSYSTHKCKLVKADENGCYVENDDNYMLKNTLFDGQSLIEKSVMNTNDITRNKGGVLLRNHFFKSFALNTNIQSFMRERFGASYDTATITDRYGRKLLAKNIKLITTENSMKWEKFDFSIDNWCKVVSADNNLFGIVKTEKPSKYGDLVKMSYQMLNSLDPDKIDLHSILKDTLVYTDNIQNSIDAYIGYLGATSNDMNSNKMLADLYNRNHDIAGTSLFRAYKKQKIQAWKNMLRAGRILINGDNCTLVSNPYTMLLHSIRDVAREDERIDSSYVDVSLGEGNAVHTTLYENGERLSCFRSPHNSPNNLYYATNIRNRIIDKYFNATPNIIIVNSVNTDISDRCNGADFDSDFFLVTNQKDIVEFTKLAQTKYPTIVNCVEMSTKTYKNTSRARADIDNTLAIGKNDTGISSNLSQLALSWYYETHNPGLSDICCIGSVLAQIAIDSSKRSYNLSVGKEINKIKKMDCMQVKVGTKDALPSFWKYTNKNYNKEKHEQRLLKVNCTMCNLEDEIDNIKDSNRVDNVDMLELLDPTIKNKYKHEQVQSVIDKYTAYRTENRRLINEIANSNSDARKLRLSDERRQNLIDFNIDMRKIKINARNMKALIKKSIDNKLELDIDFLNMLYQNNPTLFLSIFTENNTDEKGVNKDVDKLVS